MSPEEASDRLQGLLAHLWMVRTFLKHAEEIQDQDDFLAVPRTVFDYVRAPEPSAQRGDVVESLRRLRGKLPKLRHAAEFFAGSYPRVSDHTNFQMASLSLTACVRQIEEILGQVVIPPSRRGPADQGPALQD
jgi:hypothetical protein